MSESPSQLYTEARKRVADSQFSLVRKALRTDQSFPKEEDIEQVYSGIRDRAGLIAELKRSLGAGQRLLLEAEVMVSALAAEMVSDGLNQLTAQLHALDDKPTAHTPQGSRRELASRQADVVHALKPAPTRKVYPVFPLAAKTAQQHALDRWDVRVAEAIAAVVAQFQQGERTLPADLEAKMEKAICANPSAHYTATASEQAFEPLTLEIVLASRTWVRDVLQDVATRAPSKFDQPGELSGMLAALEPWLEAGAAPRERWRILSYDVRRAVERTIETVRQRLAKVQAARECPGLMKGAWIPDEKLLLSHDPSLLVRRDLAKLPIWQAGRPPEESAVLREAWDLWLEAARNALELGHVAINSQRRLIDEQKPEILGHIKQDPSPGSSHWIDAYAATVARQWSSAPAPASSRYPRLFKVTQTEIEGIVVSALDLVVKDAQAALVQRLFPIVDQEIVNLAKAGKSPVFEPHYQAFRATVEGEWTKHKLAPLHAELFSATDDAIRSRVQQSVDAQLARLKQITVFEHQSKHVTENEAAIGKRARGGEFSTHSAALEGYYALVRKSWENSGDPLQPNAPELLDKTKGLIQSKVALNFPLVVTPPRLDTPRPTDNMKNLSDGNGHEQTTPVNLLAVAKAPVSNSDGPAESKNPAPAGVVIPSPSSRDEGPQEARIPPSEKLSSRISPLWLLLLLPLVGLALWLWLG